MQERHTDADDAEDFSEDGTFERAGWYVIAIIAPIYLAFAACFVGAL